MSAAPAEVPTATAPAARAPGPVRVLVFPAGTEVGLEIGRALERSLNVRLHGAGSRDDHGALAFARYATLPSIADPDFDARFAALLAHWEIELVFASHDDVQEYLAPRIAAWGAGLVNGDPQACQVARSKSATLAAFADLEWTPHRHHDVAAIDRWPVAVKPDRGQGGQGFTRAADATALAQAMAGVEQPLVTEFLPGEEITLDQATWNYDDAEYTWDDMDCRCGARGCRGGLTEKDWMLSELQARYQGHFHPIVQKMIDALDRVTPIR